MTSGKGSKLLRYVEHRIRVTLSDSRTLLGTFLAFDKHLNLVLSETEEFRSVRKSKSAVIEERQEKRTLGLIIVRGDNVVSISVEGPPPPEKKARVTRPGPGSASIGAGRGVNIGMMPPMVGGALSGAPVGLGAAPVHGLGLGPGGMGRGVPTSGTMPPPPPPY